MSPLLRYWFAGSADMDTILHFKERVHSMSDEEYIALYANLKCRSLARPTDASEESLDWVMRRITPDCRSLLDVGCGRGYWLDKCNPLGLDMVGCDITGDPGLKHAVYRQGSVEKLPFPDHSFDVVTCFHVLEHVRRLNTAVRELMRVARRKLFIIVPCQRYYKYTLDLHIHFFPSAKYFQSLMELPNSECEPVGTGNGDIVYLARLG